MVSEMIDPAMNNLLAALGGDLYHEAQLVAGTSWQKIALDSRCSPDGSSVQTKLRLVTTNGAAREVQISPRIQTHLGQIWQLNPVIQGPARRGRVSPQKAESDLWYGLKIAVTPEGQIECTYDYESDCQSRLFTEDDDQAPQISIAFTNLFLQHVAGSFDKQIAFQGVLAACNGPVDLDAERAQVILPLPEGETAVPAQILGQERGGHTWVWAWSLEGLPEAITRLSLQMRDFGEKNEIAELVEAEVPMANAMMGNMFAMIALGLFQRRSYMRKAFENGPAFIIIDQPAEPDRDNSIPRIANMFPQLLANFDIANHRAAFLGYLAYYNFKVDQEASRIIAKSYAGELTAEFDELDRLTGLQGKIN